MLRINARTTKKNKPPYAVFVRRANNIRLNGDVVGDKIRRILIVRQNAADHCGGKHHKTRALLLEKRIDSPLIEQIKFVARTQQQPVTVLGPETTYDRRADQTTVACDKNRNPSFVQRHDPDN